MVVLRLEKLLKSSHASAGAQNRVRVGFGVDFSIFEIPKSRKIDFSSFGKRLRLPRLLQQSSRNFKFFQVFFHEISWFPPLKDDGSTTG